MFKLISWFKDIEKFLNVFEKLIDKVNNLAIKVNTLEKDLIKIVEIINILKLRQDLINIKQD